MSFDCRFSTVDIDFNFRAVFCCCFDSIFGCIFLLVFGAFIICANNFMLLLADFGGRISTISGLIFDHFSSIFGSFFGASLLSSLSAGLFFAAVLDPRFSYGMCFLAGGLLM